MHTSGEWKVINGRIVASEHGRIQDTIAKVFDSPPTDEELANANLIAAAPRMYEALKNLPRPKSLLEDVAYTGGGVPKKWRNERGHFNDGYNQALKDVAGHNEQALAKADLTR